MKSSQEIERYSEVVGRSAVIHAGAHEGGDYTLCGAATDGEDGNSHMMRTRRLITCLGCIGIILYCKEVPRRLLNAPPIIGSTAHDVGSR